MGLLLIIVIAVVAGGIALAFAGRNQAGGQFARSRPGGLSDAEAEARRWVERLGAGVGTLSGTGNIAATQALADAAERHSAASVQLADARTVTQYALVGQTAIEGLHYIRAARTALGLDPGPQVPGMATAGQASATERVIVDGQEYVASARPGDDTPHYYPGGMLAGRRVQPGWYRTPWWKTALIGGAAGVGGFLLADALFDGIGGMHHMHDPGGFGDAFGGFGDGLF